MYIYTYTSAYMYTYSYSLTHIYMYLCISITPQKSAVDNMSPLSLTNITPVMGWL